jgi:hypothetical protein
MRRIQLEVSLAGTLAVIVAISDEGFERDLHGSRGAYQFQFQIAGVGAARHENLLL